jgi:hypothetical protein
MTAALFLPTCPFEPLTFRGEVSSVDSDFVPLIPILLAAFFQRGANASRRCPCAHFCLPFYLFRSWFL